MTNPNLSLSARADRPLVAAEASSDRMVEWTITASDIAQRDVARSRPPLNLALVLDRSGSMHGAKLRYAQQAAVHVLDHLDQRDRAAVVAYDDETVVLAGSEHVTPAVRQAMQGKINALAPGGSTDLGGGWLRGCQEIAAHELQGINRALLLTDGLANRGITDLEELTQHARELRRRGITTSTFGVGLDFNEQLLEALAEAGGGHFFYIQRPEQIPEAFRDELGELFATAAREAFLNITVPKGVTVEVLGDLPHERNGDRIRVFMGDVIAGQGRQVFTRVLTPPDMPGSALVLRAELGYADLDGRAQTTYEEVSFSYAPQAQVQMTLPDAALRERASEVEVASAASRALKLERQGQRVAAQAMMQESLLRNAPYMAAPAAASYNQLADDMAGGLNEAERKDAHFASYKLRQGRGKKA